jgi:5-(carboxyamino)imidazole ribonucleotide synthase
VHNSGHLTIEGSRTSQFEQHLRAILDWPLGPTGMCAPAVAMANVVGGRSGDPRTRQSATLAAVPEAHLHLYGKTSRPRRKVGHVTVLGDDRERVRRRAALAATTLAG